VHALGVRIWNEATRTMKTFSPCFSSRKLVQQFFLHLCRLHLLFTLCTCISIGIVEGVNLCVCVEALVVSSCISKHGPPDDATPTSSRSAASLFVLKSALFVVRKRFVSPRVLALRRAPVGLLTCCSSARLVFRARRNSACAHTASLFALKIGGSYAPYCFFGACFVALCGAFVGCRVIANATTRLRGAVVVAL
jgi:hypothetical protein